jgi:hypothetical protein
MLLGAVWCSGNSETPGSIAISCRSVCLALFVEVLSLHRAEGEVASCNRPRHPLSTFVTISRFFFTFFHLVRRSEFGVLKLPNQSFNKLPISVPANRSVNLWYCQIWTIERVYTSLSEILHHFNIFNCLPVSSRLIWKCQCIAGVRTIIFQYVYNKMQRYTVYYIWKLLTCFGWYLHPSSGAHTTVPTASGICHTVTATCRSSGR